MSVAQDGSTHNNTQPDYTLDPSGSAPPLSDEDRRMLEEGSAISPEVLAESGACSITHGRDLPDVFSDRQRRRAPGVLFTVHRLNGKTTWCFRPGREDPDNPGHKYEQPCKALGGAGNALGILPSQRHLIADTRVPVVFVEGTKKALSLISAARKAGVEVLVVAIIGVWNWLQDGGKPIQDMLDIPLEGRNATVMFDSDMLRKVEVQMAASRLAEYLQGRGAKTFVTYFRDLAGGGKCGADDFFVSGGTFSELRLLTRKYDPRDFARVRLSRDATLGAMVADLVRRFLAAEYKRQGGHTDRDMALVLTKSAAECGKPVRGGLYVEKSWADLELEVKIGPRTVSKSLKRLEASGFIARRVKGKTPDKRGGFVLCAGVKQVGTERDEDHKVTHLLGALYAATIHPRAPRLCWSSPGSRSKRGTVKGSRKVRQSKPAEPKPAIRRPGKVRGALIDTLDAFERAGGRFTLADLCAALHRKRPRDLTRRKKPGSKGRDGLLIMLIDAGIVVLDGEHISLTPDWRERLDDVRRAGREIDSRVVLTRSDGSQTEYVVDGDETIARRRAKIKRQGYREFRRRRSQEQPDSKTSKASEDAIRRNREARERGMAEGRRRAATVAAKTEQDRTKRRRVEKLVREGMARRFAEQEVYVSATRSAPPAGPPGRETGARKIPRMVEGVYVHGAVCECEWCAEDLKPRYACSRRSA